MASPPEQHVLQKREHMARSASTDEAVCPCALLPAWRLCVYVCASHSAVHRCVHLLWVIWGKGMCLVLARVLDTWMAPQGHLPQHPSCNSSTWTVSRFPAGKCIHTTPPCPAMPPSLPSPPCHRTGRRPPFLPSITALCLLPTTFVLLPLSSSCSAFSLPPALSPPCSTLLHPLAPMHTHTPHPPPPLPPPTHFPTPHS